MYNIYHIPGKKIGVTRNLNKRVTEQQGYAPEEYEVLFTSDDIEIISAKEIELQKSYGYKVDRQTYKNLIKSNKMKINATEQTSTFPYPLNKLKGNLLDHIGAKWSTEFGTFEITTKTIPWIMQNCKTSMYNDKRSYIYNKAFYEAFYNTDHNPDVRSDERFDLIRNWAATRGLYNEGNSHTQYVKLQEEAGELAKALLKNDKPEVIDAIGDIVVVLTNLAHLEGYNIEYCIDEAYKVIAARTGKMINGTFVKDTDNE
jgi:NTP pyrophosphatase (non-canonical NTP hydrolase)|tara:strand:- start:1127 stop:1900 length:774 start_codon:yes stop_codon:yes gene_type:complete